VSPADARAAESLAQLASALSSRGSGGCSDGDAWLASAAAARSAPPSRAASGVGCGADLLRFSDGASSAFSDALEAAALARGGSAAAAAALAADDDVAPAAAQVPQLPQLPQVPPPPEWVTPRGLFASHAAAAALGAVAAAAAALLAPTMARALAAAWAALEARGAG
jgi:hypothetical protein